MDAFSYVNIFSTKGIEYLIVISFFILVIPFWRTLKETYRPTISLSGSRVPRGIYFDATHSWVFLESAGRLKVGIDDFMTALTGRVTLIPAAQPGETIKRGEHLATLQGDGKSLKIYSPVSGELNAINNKAFKLFSRRTRQEFTENWLFDVKPYHWEMERSLLFMGEKARQWIKQESARLRDVLAFAQQKYEPVFEPVLLQEGGELVDKVLESLPSEIWEEVQSEFIDAVKQ